MKRTFLLIGFLTTCSVCFIPLGYAQTEISLPSQESPVINPPVGITLPNDTYFHLQWSHNNTGSVPVFPGVSTGADCGLPGFDMNIPEAWEFMNNQPLSQVKVGILDSGLDPNIDPSTSDLDPARLLQGMNFYDSIPNSNTSDTQGHGTHVLGAIAATVNNGRGIAGVDRNCQVMPIKMDPTGTREQRANIAAAINYGIQHDIKVFNMSWGWNEITIDNDIREAISYGIANGCTFVGAAGNDNHNGVDFPAKVAIAVGAVNPCGYIKSPATAPGCDQDLRIEKPGDPLWGSNYGAGLDLMGPGTMLPAVDISGPSGLSAYTDCNAGACYLSAENGNYVRNAFGTSIATPYVTGIVSQMLAINNQLKQHEIESLLYKASDALASGGYLFPDAFEAVVLASDHTPGNHPVADLAVDQLVYERINADFVRATVTISNRSLSVASDPTHLSVYTSFPRVNSHLDARGPDGHDTISIPSIAPNTTQIYQVIIPYEYPGAPNTTDLRLWLNAVIDPNMLLEESDKANNARGIPVTHDQILLPDLRPYQVSYTTSPGNTVQLTGQIINEGGKNAVFPSGSVVAKFWASNDGTLNETTDLLIGSQTIPGPLTLAYQQTYQFSKSLTLTRTYLIIQVDPNGLVTEGNESNNRQAIQIGTIPTGAPDLHPNNVSYSVNVTSLGKAVNMSYSIKNSGNANGTLYLFQDAVRYWDSYDSTFSDGDDQLLGVENMNGVFTIPPQQSMLFPNKNKLATRSFLIIQVIPDTQHGETNTANNFYAIPLIQTTGSDEEQIDPPGEPQQILTSKQVKEAVDTDSPVTKTDSDNPNGESLPVPTGRLEPDVLSDELQLELFPNPAREQVTLAIEIHGAGQITLTDLLGHRLHEQALTENGKQKLVLDTGSLSTGVYLVELKQASGKSILKKLIIH